MARIQKAVVAMTPTALYLFIKELLLEVFFSEAADWLKSNTDVAGDFIGWQWSTLIISIILMIVGGLIVGYGDRLTSLRVGRSTKPLEQRPRTGVKGRGRSRIEIDELEVGEKVDQAVDVSDDARFKSRRTKID